MHGVKWTSWKGCSSNTYTARTNIRPKTAAGLLWWKVWDALLLPVNVVKWTPPQPNASPEYLSFNMCYFHAPVYPSSCRLTVNLSLSFVSEIHAWSHAICQKGLSCVGDRLGNPPSWVSSSWQPSCHFLLLIIYPFEPSYPALLVSSWWQEVHSTQDVLCNPSHDHTGPWEQVGWHTSSTHTLQHTCSVILEHKAVLFMLRMNWRSNGKKWILLVRC